MFRTTSAFDKLLDKATSHLRLEPDWPTILQINDQIRQGDVQAKYALAAIKKKLTSQNPHVAMFALTVLESSVKNCGSLVHDEIGTKAYMEQLREFVKTCPHENVKTKTLELIQAWAFAFRNSPKYRAVQDTMNIMKAEDYKFPALKESDAMFSADTAPDWAEGDCCHRCRVQFSLIQRKHHCRACGQVFCAQCSSRTCTLPKFGIEKEVRVCESCYTKINKPTSTTKQNSTEELPIEYLNSSLAQQSQKPSFATKGIHFAPDENDKNHTSPGSGTSLSCTSSIQHAPPPRKSEDELREEEELQLALALSQSEAEQSNKQRVSRGNVVSATAVRAKTYSPPPMSRDTSTSSPLLDEVDPELARYLNRSYWETRTTDESSPSAPANPPSTAPGIKQLVEIEQNGVASDSEMEEFVRNLKSQVEIFVNRMKSNSSRGRSIANDSSVQKLFMNITAMHSKLLHYIQQQDDSRVYYEGLQDKLVQVKDARAALDALRDEHREKLRREAEMAERQRQHQMAQKLDIMRKKKQEYLQYQRQLTLQRIQEQEREMQMRQEQQKQQYLMGSQYASLGYAAPGGYDSLPSAGYSMQPGSVPPGFPHYASQGLPGMMMPPQGYMPVPGAPPSSIMRPVMGPMMHQITSLPAQMMGPMPPHSSPAHMPPSQGGHPNHQGALPHGQMPPIQGQMSDSHSQVQGQQGQFSAHQGQIPPPQGQLSGPHIQNIQGQIQGLQGQLQMSSSQIQIPTQATPNQTQSQCEVPRQMIPSSMMAQQSQMAPSTPMSPSSNVPMPHVMMGQQTYQPPPPQQQESTAELISFD